MATLSLRNIDKIYDNNVQAVFGFTLDIEDKEFIVFVGPSGCGKSTTLRMIAGLEDISAGELYIDDQLMNDVAPKDRNIAMVFQSYALYPHMTVYENLAFGLRNRHVPEDVIKEKVLEAAKILDIEFTASSPVFAVVKCGGGINAKDKYNYVGESDCVAQANAIGGKKVC